MLFGHEYKVRFTLADGRSGRTTIEARAMSAKEILEKAKEHIAFEVNCDTNDVTITKII